MTEFSREDLMEGIRYREYVQLFKKDLAEGEEVEIRRGWVVLQSVLFMAGSAVGAIVLFMLAIFLFSEVLDVDLSGAGGRIGITACGLILFFICVGIFRRYLARIGRARRVGDRIRRPPRPVSKYIDAIVEEISTGSAEDTPRLIEFDSVKFGGSMYETRARWRGMLLDEDCFLYQPKTKVAKLVQKSTITIEEKGGKSEVEHFLVFGNRELSGVNKLTETMRSRLSEFLEG